jgi:hypothetical protein
VIFNKTLRYHTENLNKELKLLPIQKLYYKTIVIFLKKHNIINPIPYYINTRYAKNNFLINWPNKTTSGRHFQIIGTKII